MAWGLMTTYLPPIVQYAVSVLCTDSIQGLYKKYREQFFPGVTVRSSKFAPSATRARRNGLLHLNVAQFLNSNISAILNFKRSKFCPELVSDF